MSDLVRRRYSYFQHAREYINQLREAERRRRNSIVLSMNTAYMSVERIAEILGRNIVTYGDKQRIRRSKTIFHTFLTKYTKLYFLHNAEIEGKTDEPCTICLMEYEANKQLRLLNCGHLFHRLCVDRWLQRYLTCPLCRCGILGNNYTFPPGQTSVDSQPDDTLESGEEEVEGGYQEYVDDLDLFTDEDDDDDEEDENNMEEVVEHATQREVRVDVLREVFPTNNQESNSDEDDDEEGEDEEEDEEDEVPAKRARLCDGDRSSDGAGPSSSPDEDNGDCGDGNENTSSPPSKSRVNNEDFSKTL